MMKLLSECQTAWIRMKLGVSFGSKLFAYCTAVTIGRIRLQCYQYYYMRMLLNSANL